MGKVIVKARKKTTDLNIEIDYDKLAEAIVRANKIVEEDCLKEQENLKNVVKQDGTMKILCKTIFTPKKLLNKSDFTGHYKLFFAALSLAYTLGTVVFIIAAIISLILAVLFIFFQIKANAFSLGYSLMFLYSIIIAVLCGAIQGFFRLANSELDKIRDMKILATLFSGMSSFIAMIVAIVALITGGLL